MERYALPEAPHQLRKNEVGFAGEDNIQEGKSLMQLPPHSPGTVGTPHHQDFVGKSLLDTFGQSEGSQVLLEHGSETDDIVALPVNVFQAGLEEGLHQVRPTEDAVHLGGA